MASYRLNGSRCDRGVRYLTEEGRLLSGFVRSLCQRGVLEPWIEQGHIDTPEGIGLDSPRTHYVAPQGMSQIAKELGQGLTVWYSRRVQTLTAESEGWRLALEAVKEGSESPLEVRAKAVILAIPAPQALPIVETLPEIPPETIAPLAAVTYDPCLTLLAQYPQNGVPAEIPWRSLECPNDPDVSWLGLDSSKGTPSQPRSDRPLVVINSSPEFGRSHIDDEDVTPVIEHLLNQGAAHVGDWLKTPETTHLHRWRYAFPRHTWSQDSLVLPTPHPLICCGDWCGSHQVETALRSGLAAASAINAQLQQHPLPPPKSIDELPELKPPSCLLPLASCLLPLPPCPPCLCGSPLPPFPQTPVENRSIIDLFEELYASTRCSRG